MRERLGAKNGILVYNTAVIYILGLPFDLYLSIMAIAALASLLIGARAWFGARRALSRSFALFESAVFIWCMFAVVEWLVPDPGRQYDMLRLQYIGIAFVPGTAFLIARALASRPFGALKSFVTLLPGFAFSAVIITNDSHLAFWRGVEVGPHWVEPEYGWALWLFIAYAYLQIAVALVCFVKTALRARGVYARWMKLILAFFFLPFISNVIYIAAISGKTGYDLTPVSFAASGLLMAFILSRFDVFEPLPYAKSVILESIDTPMLVLDAEGYIVGANDEANRTFSSFGALEGLAFSSLDPGFRSAMTDRETLRWSRDGTDYLIACYVIQRDRVDWRGRLILFRDISEITRAERELEAARAKAEAANASKSALVAIVSHELRNPLNAIIGIADLNLRREIPSGFREDLEMIRSSGRLLLGIINDLLDISKMEAGKLELECSDFDLAEAALSAVRAFEPAAAAKGLSLAARVEEGLPRFVKGDPLRFEQVLMNLLGNAIKFTQSGEVRVALRPFVPAGADGDGRALGIAVEVRDTGIGISKEGQERLFKDFSQADRSIASRFGGTGLGLSVSKRIVELMGGSISVESEEGSGSAFTFTARFEPGDPGRASATTTERPGQSVPRPLRILIVDDDPMSAQVARRYLERSGHETACVGTGGEGIKGMLGGGFDLALVDIGLPDMNGLEAIARFRAEEAGRGGRKLYVAAMTADSEPDLFSRCESSGVDDLLNKPLDPSRLARVVERSGAARGKPDPIAASGRGLPRTTAGSSSLIDGDALLAHLGGDESFLERMLGIFIREVPGRIAAIDGAVAARDLAGLRTLVHGIRGSSLTLRAGPLSMAASSVEAGILAAIKEGADYDCGIHAESLKAIMKSTAEAARKIVERKEAAERSVAK